MLAYPVTKSWARLWLSCPVLDHPIVLKMKKGRDGDGKDITVLDVLCCGRRRGLVEISKKGRSAQNQESKNEAEKLWELERRLQNLPNKQTDKQ